MRVDINNIIVKPAVPNDRYTEDRERAYYKSLYSRV